MTSPRTILLLLMLGLCGLIAGVPAVTAAGKPIIQVLAQDPPAGATLAVGDRLFLRVGYRSDVPVRFQADGYRQGIRQEEPFGNSAPPYDAGEGEALVWIGFPVAVRIDEISLTAYDLEWQKLEEVTLPMVMTWDGEANATSRPLAEWIGPLMKHHRQVFDQAYDPQPQKPATLFDVFFFISIIAIPLYLALQIKMLIRCPRGWRKYVIAPLLPIAPLGLYSLFGLGLETAYWVIFLFRYFPVALAYLMILWVVKRFYDRRQRADFAR